MSLQNIDFLKLMTEDLGKALVFPKFRPYIREYYLKAGIDEVPFFLFGSFFWVSTVITAVLYIGRIFSLTQIFSSNFFFFFIATFLSWFIVQGAIITFIVLALYAYMDVKIYNRTKSMELILPEFLRRMSENVRGGMAFEKALWSSISPDMGVLAIEIHLAAKKVITGSDVETALKELTSKYDSPTLKRSFDLLVEALKGGGSVADLIDRIVENIEETKELKAELAATNLTYTIFISFVILIITPGLFALSFQFIVILGKFSAGVGDTGEGAQLPVNLGSLNIRADDFKNFSYLALFIIATFASGIISLITKGDIRAGVRYIPLYIAGSLIAYFVFLSLTTAIFANIFI